MSGKLQGVVGIKFKVLSNRLVRRDESVRIFFTDLTKFWKYVPYVQEGRKESMHKSKSLTNLNFYLKIRLLIIIIIDLKSIMFKYTNLIKNSARLYKKVGLKFKSFG